MKRGTLILVIAAGVLALTLLAAAAFIRPYTYHGSLIDPAQPAPPIALVRADGSAYNLADQQGKVVLLFFGYTTCPDVCPATLGQMKSVVADLKEHQDQVQVVFITVDPQRDTPERMQDYLAGFNSSFIGLSGSEAQLEPVYKGYGVYRQIREEESAAGYLVDHSSRVYLIDPNGNLRLTYSFGTAPDDVADDVRQVLKEAR